MFVYSHEIQEEPAVFEFENQNLAIGGKVNAVGLLLDCNIGVRPAPDLRFSGADQDSIEVHHDLGVEDGIGFILEIDRAGEVVQFLP